MPVYKIHDDRASCISFESTSPSITTRAIIQTPTHTMRYSALLTALVAVVAAMPLGSDAPIPVDAAVVPQSTPNPQYVSSKHVVPTGSESLDQQLTPCRLLASRPARGDAASTCPNACPDAPRLALRCIPHSCHRHLFSLISDSGMDGMGEDDGEWLYIMKPQPS